MFWVPPLPQPIPASKRANAHTHTRLFKCPPRRVEPLGTKGAERRYGRAR